MSLCFDMPSQEMLERKVNGADIPIPMFECPLAIQNRSGRTELKGSVLETDQDVSSYLFVDSEDHIYVGVNPTSHVSSFKLHTPEGDVNIDRLGFGKVELRTGDTVKLNVEAVTLSGNISFKPAPKTFTVMVNGEDVTSKGQRVTKGGKGEFRLSFKL